MGRRNPGKGQEIFAYPKREGQHKFDTAKRWLSINFTASLGRVTFFNKNIKGGLGHFTVMLIGIPPAHPASKKLMLPNLREKKKGSNRKPRTTLGARSYYFFSEVIYFFPLSSRVTQKTVRSAPRMLVDGEYIVSIINSVRVNSA